ncbi:thymidine kinase [Shewanella fidelis]|uniref:Thymidine kinase n=1 Tax=Shewanella fidelis TaxID=173509 RepID=A0AAW8NJR6_9GAMM|nr:thymidine kinase [Shewanella fidelis]MDR8523102.1 thymidine kinase [Shewanella fidelis]MDW4811572.1 thymidine kinase [Shewanella fidelis]MDW4815693.1 thymidine kinase [Shewanella fidelis]MDW4819783.1 thymidine kinase [Shewanella fidelis]MDW4824243.1 thymidine kinase [Shewanella fidelis]
MAQLYFYYSAMNAGKSTSLLQSSYNYRERGMNTLVMTASIDDRYGVGKVASRIGIETDAQVFGASDNLIEMVRESLTQQVLHCILIDESQFLSKEQVKQLTYVVDVLDIPVLCYGLKTDFQGELFSGSQYLLAWADKLVELKTICHCGRKANMVVRLDGNGKPMREGEQVAIGGNESYESVCRKHFREFIWD